MLVKVVLSIRVSELPRWKPVAQGWANYDLCQIFQPTVGHQARSLPTPCLAPNLKKMTDSSFSMMTKAKICLAVSAEATADGDVWILWSGHSVALLRCL